MSPVAPWFHFSMNASRFSRLSRLPKFILSSNLVPPPALACSAIRSRGCFWLSIILSMTSMPWGGASPGARSNDGFDSGLMRVGAAELHIRRDLLVLNGSGEIGGRQASP